MNAVLTDMRAALTARVSVDAGGGSSSRFVSPLTASSLFCRGCCELVSLRQLQVSELWQQVIVKSRAADTGGRAERWHPLYSGGDNVQLGLGWCCASHHG
eukprot:554679-Rhodomonas_salina.1